MGCMYVSVFVSIWEIYSMLNQLCVFRNLNLPVISNIANFNLHLTKIFLIKHCENINGLKGFQVLSRGINLPFDEGL